MQSLLVSSFLVLGVHMAASFERARLYSEPNGKGMQLTTHGSLGDLTMYNFNNKMDSVYQSGLWIYYEHPAYNAMPGYAVVMYGDRVSANLPEGYSNIVSSVRLVKSSHDGYKDLITLYSGTGFAGQELITGVSRGSLDYMADQVSSLIVIGSSPWTIYSDYNYSGQQACVYPSTDYYVNDDGEVVYFGLYVNMTSVGFLDNSIQSVLKGCSFWSRNEKQ
ncbi:gamma-crystallin N-like [Scylla paramamosain]